MAAIQRRRRTKRKTLICDLPITRAICSVLASPKILDCIADLRLRFQLLHRGERLCPVGVLNAALGNFNYSNEAAGFYVGRDYAISARANENAAEILRTLMFPVWDNEPPKEATQLSSQDATGQKRCFREGSPRTVLLDRYERNRHARAACLAHYGTDCVVCGISFEDVYGELGLDFIHVHHIRSLSAIKQEYEVDPIQDLRPVCPNCHAMIHSRTPSMTIAELRAIMLTRTRWRSGRSLPALTIADND
jgi:hypothetical protein